MRGWRRAGLERVPSERGDAAAGVAEDRQALLVREREDRLQVGMVEREALGARVQLDAAGTRRECPFGLGERGVVRVETAEREQAPAGRLGLADDHVVRLAVAAGLLHGEDDRPRVDPLERRH